MHSTLTSRLHKFPVPAEIGRPFSVFHTDPGFCRAGPTFYLRSITTTYYLLLHRHSSKIRSTLPLLTYTTDLLIRLPFFLYIAFLLP